jgi:hypothetical protein
VTVIDRLQRIFGFAGQCGLEQFLERVGDLGDRRVNDQHAATRDEALPDDERGTCCGQLPRMERR